MGICISRWHNNGVSQLCVVSNRRAANWFQRRHTSWQHCVVQQQRREPNPRRRRQACQRTWLARHGRHCLGVVPGLVWALFISKRDKPHRARYCHGSSAARRLLELLLQQLPWLAAQQRLPVRRLRQYRVPCRQGSVIPFSLFPFPFSLGIVRGLRRG